MSEEKAKDAEERTPPSAYTVIKKKPVNKKKRSGSEWFMLVMSVLIVISMVGSLFLVF
jgi:hypothetical protein